MSHSIPRRDSLSCLVISRAPDALCNPEQTASPLSMMIYSFLASRVPHLSHDMLPPLADYNYTKNLVQRSFKACVYFSLMQPLLTRSVSTCIPFPVAAGGIFWGLMTILRTSHGRTQLSFDLRTPRQGILPNVNSCHHQSHIVPSRAGWNE
jgi:hypothetical protein